LIDEDVPRSTARTLREAGYDTVDGRDVGLRQLEIPQNEIQHFESK